MTRIMRDSVTPNAIPLGGTDIAAGYDDGTFANIAQIRARFPHVPVVHIDVRGSMPGAHVRDWETGDKGGNLEEWVIQHNQLSGKKDAVVYANRSTIPEVRRLTGSQILGKDYWLWVATLDGTIITPQQQFGLVACQDKGSRQTGGNYDESVVFADWWMAAPPTVKAVMPPGQWKNPSEWTWGKTVTIQGVGLDGKQHIFGYHADLNEWVKVQ